jgi:hypothetical protein
VISHNHLSKLSKIRITNLRGFWFHDLRSEVTVACGIFFFLIFFSKYCSMWHLMSHESCTSLRWIVPIIARHNPTYVLANQLFTQIRMTNLRGFWFHALRSEVIVARGNFIYIFLFSKYCSMWHLMSRESCTSSRWIVTIIARHNPTYVLANQLFSQIRMTNLRWF